MPFTLAHPLGALPLKWVKRSWFSTTGLVVGSMAPDYEYFLKQQPSPTLSETGWGALLFDFPLAILVALVFHLLVKQPLIRHLPAPFDLRLSGYAQTSFLTYLGRHWAVFLLSVVLGIASHLFLDWVTNPSAGPFSNTLFTRAMVIGPLKEMPLTLTERSFDVLATLLIFIILLKTVKPAVNFLKVPAARKLLYWSIIIVSVAALMLWEWYEVAGFEGFAKGITTFLWAGAFSLVLASVFIRVWSRAIGQTSESPAPEQRQ